MLVLAWCVGASILRASDASSFFYDGFESGDISTNTGGFSWDGLNRTSIVDMEGGQAYVIYKDTGVVHIATPGVDWTAHNGNNSMRFRYPAGIEWSEQRFSVGRHVPDLWIRYWIRVPPNFTHGSLNNKWLALWVANYDTQGDVTWQTRPDGSGGANLVVQDGGVAYPETLSTPFISVPADRGRWMQVVARVKAASSATANDGIIQFYRRWDGDTAFVKLHEKLNARVYEPGGGISAGYIMGWANDPYVEETVWLLDDYEMSESSLLTVSDPSPVAPSIAIQPADATVGVGTTAIFTVAATGTPVPTYQWRKDGTAITGATGASYTTPATVQADSGAVFSVVVSNSAGSVTSAGATLTVTTANVAPVITSQPANQTISVGNTATFTVAATGTPAPTYQWRKGGAAITGATSASYTTPATVQADSGAVFSVVVSNSAGSVTSAGATLNVQAASTPTSGGTGSSGGGCGAGGVAGLIVGFGLMLRLRNRRR